VVVAGGRAAGNNHKPPYFFLSRIDFILILNLFKNTDEKKQKKTQKS
jgi:hypothetical protein